MEGEEALSILNGKMSIIQENSMIQLRNSLPVKELVETFPLSVPRHELDSVLSRVFCVLMDNPDIRNHIKEQTNSILEMLSVVTLSKPVVVQRHKLKDRKAWRRMINDSSDASTIQKSPAVTDHMDSIPTSDMDMQIILDRVPECAFWTLMENESVRTHIEEQANRVVEMLTGKPKLLPCKAKDAEKLSTEVILLSAPEVTLHSPEQTEDRNDVPSYYGEVKLSVQVLCGPPEKSLKQILQLLDSENWENKFSALCAVQHVTRHRPESLRVLLSSLSFAVSAEVKNLRSAVSKTAMATLCVMFHYFKKSMNNIIAETGAVLLYKVLDLNVFIQQQASEALTSMVENCCSLQVLNTLVNTGLVHRAVAVRACAALNIGNLMKVVGSKKMTQWEAFSKVFVLAVSKILKDGSLDVRKHGVAIYEEIGDLHEFQRLWIKIVPVKDQHVGEALISNRSKTP